MTGRIINHRRDRQQTRRILAEIIVRGRDLTGSYFPEGFDLSDQQRRVPMNDNRQDIIAANRGRA